MPLRPIKYRVRDLNRMIVAYELFTMESGWSHIDHINLNKQFQPRVLVGVYDDNKMNFSTTPRIFIREEFTTFRDTQKVEIYEYDIVKTPDGVLYVVVFKDGAFCLEELHLDPKRKLNFTAMKKGWWLKNFYEKLTVIDNINKNPNLIGL